MRKIVAFAPIPSAYVLRGDGQYELMWDVYRIARRPDEDDIAQATHPDSDVRVRHRIAMLKRLHGHIEQTRARG